LGYGSCIKLLSLVGCAYGCALALLVAPRATATGLTWAAPVESVQLPECTGRWPLPEAAQQTLVRLHEWAAAELGQPEPAAIAFARAEALRLAFVRTVADTPAEPRLWEQLGCELELALEGEGSEAQRGEVLGRFIEELERDQLIDAAGRRLLPSEAIRAFYAGRIATMLGVPETRGMSAAMQRTYQASLVLHTPDAAASRKLFQAKAYAAAGGRHAENVLAHALLHAGDRRAAAQALMASFAAQGELRARNAALALADAR
jgi:hypothetical protein